MRTALRLTLAPITFAALCASSTAFGATITVGPSGAAFDMPCKAIAAAQDGDTIEIAAATYANDVCTVQRNGLTLRGMGGRAKLDATGFVIPNGKAIWTIAGNDTTVENIEFTGAAVVPDTNGAGIRQEGANLTVRGCYFHDNEDGILAGDNMASEILIETSEFAHNGYSDGKSHNMYINVVKKFTLRYSYSHDSIEGHLVKTRALENHILYNRLTGEGGIGSYEIDVPQGGKTYIIGNLIQQGLNSHNPSIIAYSEEGPINPVRELYVVNNTIVNDRAKASDRFVWIGNATTAPAVLRNNIFMGPGVLCVDEDMQACKSPKVIDDHNFVMSDAKLANAAAFDYHLLEGSPCVDMGADAGMGSGLSLVPQYQYVHPASFEARTSVGTIDIGAYELGGGGGAGGAGVGGGGGTGAGGGSASSSSGMTGSGSTGGQGGMSGSGGGGNDDVGEESGCGCRAVGDSGGTGALPALAILSVMAMRRRRR